MNEMGKSGQEPEALDDDEIIDLTDEVPGSGEEGIIDLTEEVAPSAGADEGIIDLVEEVASPPQEDDEIIDLVDENAPSPSADEAVLDLTDVAETPEAVAVEAAAAGSEAPEEENVIGLVEADDEADGDGSDLDGALFIDDELETDILAEPEVEEDFSDTLGISLEENPPEVAAGSEADDGVSPAEGAGVSPGEIETAVERVMDRMFSGKIEAMISESIERAVSREIEALKAALLDETSGDG
jgi:hypothetical protein